MVTAFTRRAWFFLKNSYSLHADNKSAIQSATNSVFHKQTKHIDVSFH